MTYPVSLIKSALPELRQIVKYPANPLYQNRLRKCIRPRRLKRNLASPAFPFQALRGPVGEKSLVCGSPITLKSVKDQVVFTPNDVIGGIISPSSREHMETVG